MLLTGGIVTESIVLSETFADMSQYVKYNNVDIIVGIKNKRIFMNAGDMRAMRAKVFQHTVAVVGVGYYMTKVEKE